MKSVRTVWGVLFVALGLGAAAFVALAPVRVARVGEFERSLESSIERAEWNGPEALVEVSQGEGPDVECSVPSIGKSPRIQTVHYHYGDNRRHRPFAAARSWFPFTLFALGACAVVGFVRTRAPRPEK